ncbi:MAG: SurA N-terminal domain-containing protein [Candidatus Omnitrophota bacterium]
MLKVLRHKKTAKKIWIGLALIIIPAFTMWGFGGAFGKREDKPLGKIFGRKVTDLEFKDSISAVTTAAIMRFGDKFPEVQKYLNLDSQAWDRLILLEEAKRRQIKVSDKEVIDLIESYPFFQYKGSFDNKTYNQTLQYVFRLQPRAFEEQTRQSLVLNKLYKQVTGGLRASDKEIALAFDKANQEISIYYIASLIADFTKKIIPEENKLKEYFERNRADFKEPASFNIEYFSLPSAEKAKVACGLLDGNKPMEKVAESMHLGLKQTGFFKEGAPAPGIEWLASSPETLSKLERMKHSPPIQVGGAYYILRIKGRKNAYIPEFKSIIQKVREIIVNTEAWKLAEQKINRCAQELKSRDFNQAAKECGLKAKQTPPFKFGAQIPELGSSDIFWENAKSLKQGQDSHIIKLASGFYIIKAKSFSARNETEYEKEKARYSQKILEQKQEDTFNQFLEELKNKALQ